MNDSSQKTIERPPPLPLSRGNRVWLFAAVVLVLLLGVPSYFAVRWLLASRLPASTTLPSGEPTIIASFRADFVPEQPKPGWRYYWNRNGPVGDTNGYVQLIWNGSVYATTDQPLPAPSPARYLRLSNSGGHPGQGPSQTASRGINYEHAVVIAFTMPESGSCKLVHGFISRHAGPRNGSVHLQVFVNDRDTGEEVYCRSQEGVQFDRRLGQLSAGDTVYVTVGAGETDLDDSFDLEFSIGRL